MRLREDAVRSRTIPVLQVYFLSPNMIKMVITRFLAHGTETMREMIGSEAYFVGLVGALESRPSIGPPESIAVV